jgi:hypothetical protein
VASKGKGYIVFFVAFVILVPLVIGGWMFLGPKNIRQVYAGFDNKKMSFTNHNGGDTVNLQGKITKIEYYNTTYGNYSLLTLDDTPKINDLAVGVFVISKSSYRVGNSISITLHFKKYQFNNDTFIAAEELFTPLYFYIFNLETVVRGIGVVGGITLVPMPTATGMEFTIYLPMDPQRSGYPLNLFSLSLTKGNHFGIADIIDLQTVSRAGAENHYGSGVDMNENLSGPSLNGIVEFKDVVNPGMLDTGDKISLKLPPTTDQYSYNSYVLTYRAEKNLISGATYFANGNLGVLDYPSGPMEWVHLTLMNESYIGGVWKTVFRVMDVPGVLAPYHHELKWYELALTLNELPIIKGVVTHGLVCTDSWNAHTITYRDYDHDIILNSPDEITYETTVPTKSQLGLGLAQAEAGNNVGKIAWVWGLGVVTGRNEYFDYNITISSPYNVTLFIERSLGEPGRLTTNLTDHYQFRAQLFEDYLSVINTTLVNGTVGKNNGTVLVFVDHDGNGYINAGDRFDITCRPGINYKLRLTNDRDRGPFDITWRT